VYKGEIVDMRTQKVLEPASVGTQAIQTATEGAVIILRIDDVIAAKGMGKGPGPGGPSSEYDDMSDM